MSSQKITITFWYDPEWKQLYHDKKQTKPARTKFWSDEQIREFEKQINEKDDTNKAIGRARDTL